MNYIFENNFVLPEDSALEIHSSRPGTQDEFCKMFTEGISERKEFYSPSWPAPYPNHTDCVLVLEGMV